MVYRQLRFIPGLLLLAVLLAACGGGGGDAAGGGGEGTIDERMKAYEKTLHEELDWMWDNRNYAGTHAWPDEAHCEAKDFEHYPVELDEAAREEDPTAGLLVDHLDYAAALITQAREKWDQHCQQDDTNVNTVAFLDSRLNAANESLGIVEDTLKQRKEAAAQAK